MVKYNLRSGTSLFESGEGEMRMDIVKKIMKEHRNPDLAKPMEQYMKNHFPFLGIKSPERKALTKQSFQQLGIGKEPIDAEFVTDLWNEREREYQYVALDYLAKQKNQLEKDHLPLLETLLTTKSWWDTVDMLAQHPVGTIAFKWNEVIPTFIEGWSTNENMWLRRTAILFQLRYKENTDEELLYRYILANAASNEFFIQKAIGWALREYSKTNHDAVKHFIANHQLAKLSVREGSKYIS